MHYKGIRFQLLGITFILIGLCIFTMGQTITTAYLLLAFMIIGIFLSIGGFFIKD